LGCSLCCWNDMGSLDRTVSYVGNNALPVQCRSTSENLARYRRPSCESGRAAAGLSPAIPNRADQFPSVALHPPAGVPTTHLLPTAAPKLQPDPPLTLFLPPRGGVVEVPRGALA